MDQSPPAPAESQALSNVQRVAKLADDQLSARSTGERIAGMVTRAAGTSAFASAHLVWFVGWILLNVGLVRDVEAFRSVPVQPADADRVARGDLPVLWILISQNQMSRQAERRAHLDLQINLLAEQESTATLRIVQAHRPASGHRPGQLSADVALSDETDLERGDLPHPNTR